MARVLIVEDLEELCVALSKLISRSGYQTVCATNIDDAKKAAAAEQYDVAVIDATLGKDSGLELVRSLSAIYPKLRFIVMSGYSRAHLRMTLNKRTTFLPKPFAPGKLLECIREIVEKRVA